MTESKKTRQRKKGAELLEELEKQAREIEQKKVQAYADILEDIIEEHEVVTIIDEIRKQVLGVTDAAILTSIAKAAGMKRMNISQSDPQKRNRKAKDKSETEED